MRPEARLALVLAGTALLAAAGWSITDSYVNYLARLTVLNIMVVCGLNLLIGYAGQAFIAPAATFAVAAYVSALGMMKLGLPFLVAWPAGALAAGIFGLAASLPALRLSGAYLAMISIAFNVVVVEILVGWASVTGGPVGVPAVPAASVGSYEFDNRAMLALIVVCGALTVAVCAALRKSQWGLAFLALRESEVAARSLGLDTVRLKAVAFWVSALIVGLAGGLYSHSVHYISPDIGTLFASFVFLIMLVLGGIGTLWGPVVGAVLLTILPQMLSDFQRYHLLVLGVVLLAAVTLMPKGVVQIVRLIPWERRGRADRPVAGDAGAAGLGDFVSRTGDAELVARDVRKSFGGVTALEGAAIRVKGGTIQGLIGPNGSGKSTFVNVITGFYRADGGDIRFGARPIDALSTTRIAAAGIVRTFQTPQLFADLTVQENLQAAQFRHCAPGLLAGAFALPSSWRRSREAAAEAVRLARALALEASLERRAGDLSQGDKRKLEIARALAARPALLILDEPAAGLSTEEAQALCALLEELRALGLGVLLIEHHMDVIMRVCDRITVLDRGRVIADGAPDDIRFDPGVRRAYLGSDARDPAETATTDAGRTRTVGDALQR